MDGEFFAATTILIAGTIGDLGRSLILSPARSDARLMLSRSQRQLKNLVASLPSEIESIPISVDFAVPGRCRHAGR